MMADAQDNDGQYDETGHDDDDKANYNYEEGGAGGDEGDDWDSRKAFLSRIPPTFDADSVRRIAEQTFGPGCVEDVSIVYSRDDAGDDDEGDDNGGEGSGGGRGGRGGRGEKKGQQADPRAAGGAALDTTKGSSRNAEDKKREHRGFGFLTFVSTSMRDEAVGVGKMRGGARETSRRKHTVYVRPLDRSGGDGAGNEFDGGGTTQNYADSKNACHLWSLRRCPYGDDCKFDHVGEGGCIENTSREPLSKAQRDKKKKCFQFKKRGKCKLGEGCPFSHEVGSKADGKKDTDRDDNKQHEAVSKKKDISEKDCINWKTKGKCRKLRSKKGCPYRHDEAVGEAALAKDKKRKRDSSKDGEGGKEGKTKQPLSVRVFGLNYDTTESDVRNFFGDCGPIVDVTFPKFEDSGRSRGYCCVLFQSPRAVEKAVLLNEAELHGRWLSVQAGKMLLREWEERERKARRGGGDGGDKDDGGDDAAEKRETSTQREMGEFGQKVKKRKKHGYKE